MDTRHIGWRDHLLGALLAVSYIALLMSSAIGLGMSRDESFYVDAAERYGGWYQQLLDDPSAAVSEDGIRRGWDYNHEHPALMKTLFAFSWLADEKWDLFSAPTQAHRFPGMVTAGLLLWLIYIFGARLFGREAGLFAAVAFALMPRVFYHSHLNCFDVPITLMVTLVSYCYWRSLRNPRWAIWTGLAYGLALATKHNSWILPGIFLIHWAWVIAAQALRRDGVEQPRISRVPWWLIAMVTLGPPIFLGSWPWLWHDTLHRLGGYIGFHVQHEYYNIAYFGTTYFRPPFPVSVPFVLTLLTVPLAIIALSLGGLGLRVRALLPRRLAARWWPTGAVSADDRWTDVLLVGLFLAPLIVIALPSSPIFGGTKHWMPAYPWLALYAGVGFMKVATAARRALGRRMPQLHHALRVAVAALLLAPSAVETVHSHPFGLSHYGFVAGGVPGAADLGMNRQFWGFTTGSLARYFTEQLPEGGSVYISDMTPRAWQMMQRDGLIPENVRATGDIVSADFAIVHHEDHFAEVDFQAWVAYGSVEPSYVLTYDGVPIITVYESPRHRARR